MHELRQHRLRWRWIIGALGLCLLLAGCGSGGSAATSGATPEPVAFAPGSGSGVINTALLATMPQPHSATATIALDGTATVLRLFTPDTSALPPQPVGTYVGAGRGNKLIVQLDGFHGLKVSELGSLELDAKFVSGTAGQFYMNFLVDLDCVTHEDASTLTLADMRQNRRIIVWEPRPSTQTTTLPNGYTRYTVSATSAEWGIVGTPLLGMSPHVGTTSFSAFSLAGYPNACIVDGISADNGLMRNLSEPSCVTGAGLPATPTLARCALPHKGALLLLGDSGNTTAREYHVQRIKIKDRVILPALP